MPSGNASPAPHRTALQGRALVLVQLLLSWGGSGCAPHYFPVPPVVETRFDPAHDTFAYANDLIRNNETEVAPVPREKADQPGNTKSEPFAHRCFLMARAARQFFYGARFQPLAARLSDDRYHDLVRQVLASDPRRKAPDNDPVVIPGFADLRGFSAEHEDLFKSVTGGRWRTYLQRGNWRMVFFFSARHQSATAESLLSSLQNGHPPIVHLVRFPRVTINHSLLIHRATATPTGIEFVAYDPNEPDRSQVLQYDRAAARFDLPPTAYWKGGPVKVYEIYDGVLY